MTELTRVFPPECVHGAPPCAECGTAGAVWSQFDPARGSLKGRGRLARSDGWNLAEIADRIERIEVLLESVAENLRYIADDVASRR